MKFVDINNDIAFRKIFGNKKNTEILISFLNAILELQQGKLITSVKFENPFLFPAIDGYKSSILDLKVTDEREITYIVEMQVEEPEGFDKRVQYYSSKQYSSQIAVGEDYPKLNQVIFIGILNFNFFDGNDYLTKHQILNIKTHKQELKELEFNFVELLKFKKNENELVTLVDKWIYFIKNAKNLAVTPINIDDKGLKQAYEDAAQHNWTKEELEMYDYASMRKQDEIGVVQKQIKDAVKIVLEKAKQEKEIALENEKKQTVKELYKNGISIEIIAISVKLTIEQIKNIIQNNKI
jgi:predicted transposase/invertase (TIGR01784 family)